MELWRTADPAAERPKVICSRNLTVALGLHVGVFLVFWLYSAFHGLFKKDEEIIPIDLTVVVVENLDGNEDEPPPLEKPTPPPPPPPEPPKPQPKPKPKEPEKPKELEKIVTNIVEKVEKKKEEKKPDPPKKTAKEIREERLKKMRESAKTVNKTTTVVTKVQPNGRTDKKTLSDAEIQKLLNMGYKPGKSTNLAASEEQLGYSLIKSAFEAKWDQPPWTDTMKPMTIRVWFGNGGRVINYKLEASSGDARADQSIKSAASRVGAVPALPAAFIDKYRSSGVPIRFTVKPK